MLAEEEGSREEAIKLFLRAARIDGIEGVFAVGPFGSRVSFASQQRRALNTVWALEQDGKIAEGAKVAVLGGGLAGVMAATALAARKCIVHLVESRCRGRSRCTLGNPQSGRSPVAGTFPWSPSLYASRSLFS